MKGRLTARAYVDFALVVASILLFAAEWLPRATIFILQPFAYLLGSASLFCGLVLVAELVAQGKKGIWLLIGILPALYWPALIVAMVVGCSLRLTLDCP
jgi:hypothetical protein